MFWMSGYSDDGKVYTYSSGPESGSFLYDTYFDRCNWFCSWSAGEPNLIPNEHYIHYNYYSGKWNNNAYSNGGYTNNFQYICEFGGLTDPFIAPMRTVGSKNSTITNIIGWHLEVNSNWNLTATFVNVLTPSKTFTISDFIVLSNTSVQFTIPPGTGRYTVTLVSDGTDQQLTTQYQYQIPFVSAIYPAFNVSERITVTGDNFGTVTSNMRIKVTASNIDCNDIILIKANAFSCVLTGAITRDLPLLPITYIVEDLEVTSFKAAFSHDNKLYACWNSNTYFQDSLKTYSINQRVDGLSGHLGYVGTLELAGLLQTICAENTISLWTSLQYNDLLTPPYTSLTGENQGLAINMSAFTFNDPTASQFRFSLGDNVYYSSNNDPKDMGTLTEFTIDPPSFKNDNATIFIHTEGGIADLVVGDSGTVLSLVYITFRGDRYNITRDFYIDTVFAPIAAGYGGAYPIQVTVSGFTTNNKQWIEYYPPTIVSISATNALGGSLVINGTDFYSDQSLISVTFGGKTCTNLVLITGHFSVSCLAPSGTGTVPVVLSVAGVPSQPYNFTYVEPAITSVSPIGAYGGEITVTGSLLSNDTADLTFLIGDLECTNINITVLLETFTCTLPHGGSQLPHLARLVVNSMPDNSAFMYNFLAPVIGSIESLIPQNLASNVSIYGSNFGSDQVQISIAGIQCFTSTFVSTSILVCAFNASIQEQSDAYYPVVVKASGFQVSANIAQYERSKVCPDPSCSSHGKCVDGACVCEEGWSTPLTYCSTKVIPGKPPVDHGNGTTGIIGGEVEFVTSIKYLREIDFVTSLPVKTVDMDDIVYVNSTTGSTKHLNGTFLGEPVKVFIQITTYLTATTITFAGQDLDMPSNSVKYLLDIEGWPFANRLNKLQVIYMSKTVKSATSGCNQVDTTTKSQGSQYQIDAGDSVLTAHFSDYLYADRRVTPSSLLALGPEDELVKATISKNDTQFYVLAAVIVPNFLESCQIDPSFRTLLKEDSASSGCTSENKWKLPVIIVCSVVGAATIAVGSYIYAKRKIAQNKFKKEIMTTRRLIRVSFFLISISKSSCAPLASNKIRNIYVSDEYSCTRDLVRLRLYDNDGTTIVTFYLALRKPALAMWCNTWETPLKSSRC
eukprot:gene9826-11476_t